MATQNYFKVKNGLEAPSQTAIDVAVNNLPIVRPSLSLDFANSRILDPRVVFGRASTGTYYDGKTTVKAEENLVLYSQDFDNAAWVKGASSITANSTVAPDGTTTADTITANGTTAIHTVNTTAFTASAVQRVYSIYAKAGTNNFVQITGINDSQAWANFDLSSGTLGTNGTSFTPSIVSVGSGWYRCIVTTSSATLTAFSTIIVSGSSAVRNESNSLATSIILWGAQLEQRSSVTAYTPTTTAAIINYIPVMQTAPAGVPRFDHDSITGESKGLLIEEQRTNLLTYSSAFDTAWNKSTYATVATDVLVAPDGTLTADKLIPASGNHCNIYRIVSAGGTSSTVSFYAKAGEVRYLRVSGMTGSSPAIYAVFDLQTGYTSSTVWSSSYYGNGWWRFSALLTWSSCSDGNLYLTPNSDFTGSNYVGNGYSGLYLWGAQLETGSFATSYIPTTSSTVTRAADSAYITDTSWLNQNEGTFYFDKKILGTKANQTLFSLDNGTTDIESRNILVPNSRNLLTYSEKFDNTIWTKSEVSITTDQAIAPDGSLSADKLSPTVSNLRHHVYSAAFGLSGNNTFSAFVKSAGYNKVAIGDSQGGLTFAAFDLSIGSLLSVGTNCTGSIASISNGWYKISCTGPTATTRLSITLLNPTYTSGSFIAAWNATDSTSGIYIWGAQLELGSTATSYEPNPLYLSTLEVGSNGYALSDNNTWNNLAAYAYNTNDIAVSQTNTTYASVNIQSSTAGTKAIINKTSGTVDLKNCNVRDINAGGGATYTASKTNNSYDYGNNFGITFQ